VRGGIGDLLLVSHHVIVLILLLHGLSAFLLLGAVTHQALALWMPAGRQEPGWWHSLRSVHPERYVRAVVVLFCLTALLGAINYSPFRVFARAQFLDTQVPWATGLFEIKEHATAIGLAVLPSYWAVWREPNAVSARRAFTTLLTAVAWWNFFVGHVVNNVRGL
jgi:hypothetical protein